MVGENTFVASLLVISFFHFSFFVFKSCSIFDFRKIKSCNLPWISFSGYWPVLGWSRSWWLASFLLDRTFTPAWCNTTKEHDYANTGKDHLNRMRTVETPVGKYGVTCHNLWSHPPSIQSSSAHTLEFLGPPKIILINSSFRIIPIGTVVSITCLCRKVRYNNFCNIIPTQLKYIINHPSSI